jgi:hypothetical protein
VDVDEFQKFVFSIVTTKWQQSSIMEKKKSTVFSIAVTISVELQLIMILIGQG